MDRYDEIVEQLNNARDKGVQTVQDRLDGILGSLESASTAIRDAMALGAEDLFQLGEISAAIGEMREAALDAAKVPPPVVSLDLLRELAGAKSQSDLLHGLLGALTAHAARAVVLVFRSNAVGAWSAIGFDDASQLEKWTCDGGESPLFDSFLNRPAPRRFEPADDPVVRRWLEGEAMPAEALLIPISLRGKTMGAVYADRLDGRPWNEEALQILVAVSCWMIDTLKYRIEAAVPMLADVEGAEYPPEAVTVEAQDDLPAVEAVGEAEEPVEDEVAEADEPDADEPEPEMAVESEPEESEVVDDAPVEETALDDIVADPDFDPSATVQVEVDEEPAEAQIEVVEVEPQGAVESDFADEPEESVESIEVEPPSGDADFQAPPPVEPVVPPSDLEEEPASPSAEGLSPEEESRHEEARRFARLLVSEIKLYNEEAVERGREQRDLYARLKEDIDRSREMYERRIPPEIRTSRDYFHEELVRILGDGEADALGM